MPGLIIDLSSNNSHPIDYATAKADGVIAAIVKATDGAGYVNPFYATDVAGFAAVGVPVLGYHFAEFGDAAAEAAHFVSVAGARARVLDVETNSDIEWQNTFLAALNEPADEEMDYGSASTLPQTGIRSLLWPASYGKNYGFGDCWQFTDAQVIAGIQGQVDASQWIGKQADFDALFSIAPAPAPAPVLYSPVPPPLALLIGGSAMAALDKMDMLIGTVDWAYMEYLGRPADPSGEAAYVTLLNTQGITAVIKSLTSSAEGQAYQAAKRKSLGL